MTANGFKGAADGRVTLIGDVRRVSPKEAEADGLPALYKAKHPNACPQLAATRRLGGAVLVAPQLAAIRSSELPWPWSQAAPNTPFSRCL